MPRNEFLEMLHQEHEEVMGMLTQMKKMSSSKASELESKFNMLKSALVPHIRGEEKAFYPVLRKMSDSKMDAMEAMEEHHIAEVSFMELDKMAKDEEFWMPKLMVFTELINHHIKDEESKIFKDAETSLTEDQLRDIMDEFQTEKESQKSKVMASSKSSS